MSWYSLFKVAQARYGAWISPSGEIIGVNNEEGHEDIADLILEERFGVDTSMSDTMNDPTRQLLNKGYVRFVYVPFGAEARVKLTSTQKIKIIMLANSSESRSYSFSSNPARIEETVYIVNDARNLIRQM